MKTLVAAVLGLALGFGAAVAEARGKNPPGCCKVCKNSMPCGDSCIAYGKDCDKGPGCAC